MCFCYIHYRTRVQGLLNCPTPVPATPPKEMSQGVHIVILLYYRSMLFVALYRCGCVLSYSAAHVYSVSDLGVCTVLTAYPFELCSCVCACAYVYICRQTEHTEVTTSMDTT
jgi:hypothetical protein